jgi:hypothetical protein
MDHWQLFTDYLADELSRQKTDGAELKERSLNESVEQFFKKNQPELTFRPEWPHPAFADFKTHRRIDFVGLDAVGDIELAIEAKFLPEVNATPAKFGHDLAKDLVRLALISQATKGTYFLLITPNGFPSIGNDGRESWQRFFSSFLSDDIDFKPSQRPDYHPSLWHIQKNLDGLPLPDMQIKLVASSNGSHYLARTWSVAGNAASRTYLRRIGKGRGERYEVCQGKFGGTTCSQTGCSTELYKISADDLTGIIEARAELKSPSLPSGIRPRKKLPGRNTYWICPRCDAYALGAEMQQGYTVKSWEGRSVTIHDLEDNFGQGSTRDRSKG